MHVIFPLHIEVILHHLILEDGTQKKNIFVEFDVEEKKSTTNKEGICPIYRIKPPPLRLIQFTK